MRLDDYGYLFLGGRREDRVISGGGNVYPVEVEKSPARATGVEDVAVYRPDDEWGQRVCAAVVGTASEQELTAYARERRPTAGRPSVDQGRPGDLHPSVDQPGCPRGDLPVLLPQASRLGQEAESRAARQFGATVLTRREQLAPASVERPVQLGQQSQRRL